MFNVKVKYAVPIYFRYYYSKDSLRLDYCCGISCCGSQILFLAILVPSKEVPFLTEQSLLSDLDSCKKEQNSIFLPIACFINFGL